MIAEADKNNIYPENVRGKYYVDKTCIACDACVRYALDFFEMNDDEAHAFVKRQPENKTEMEICEEALQECPIKAIGNNGDLPNRQD